MSAPRAPRWLKDTNASTVAIALAVAGFAGICGAIASSAPLVAVVAIPTAIALAALLLPVGGVAVMVFGGLLVLQGEAIALKGVYAGALTIALVLAVARLREVWQTSRAEAKGLVVLCCLSVAYLSFTGVTAAYNGVPPGRWFREVLSYVMVSLGPVLALGAGTRTKPNAVLRVLWATALLAPLSFSYAWLSRRGISAIEISAWAPYASLVLCVVPIVAAVGLFLSTSAFRWGFVSAVGGLALVLTGTRSVAAVFAGCFLFVVMLKRPGGGRSRSLVSATLLVTLVIGSVPLVEAVVSQRGFVAARLDSILGGSSGIASDQSFQLRSDAYTSTLDVVRQHFLFGAGPGHLFSSFRGGVTSLDSPFLVVAKVGVVGTLLLVSIPVATWWLVVSATPAGSLARVIVHGSFISLALLVPLGSVLDDKGLGMALALLILIGAVPGPPLGGGASQEPSGRR